MPVPSLVLHNDVEMSSPRRRSIVPQFASTPYVANDDEVERLKRRTNSELQRRVSNLRVSSPNITSDNEGGELNESKLQDHYQTCVKLFTENKINAKNAWNVHIVEYMQAMLKKGLVMKDTLKLASTSIDIGCKVYCIKVDQVHTDLFKLASAMARVNMEDDRENDDNAEPSADEDVEGNQKKKEKVKKKKKSRHFEQDCEITVVTNENTLNGIIAPHNTAIRQVSSGKSRLYTLSTITKQKWGFEQMVNCRSKFPYYTALKNDTENVMISNQKIPVTIPLIKVPIICPSFADFILDRWQPDDDDVPMGTQPLSALTQNVVYDDHGLPIPELDASVNDPDDRDNVFEDIEEIVETAVGNAELRRPVAFITEMRPGQGPLSDVPLQYSYRSAPVVSDRYMLSGVWAGPSHWKIKSLQRRTTNVDGASVNVAPQRNRRPRKSEPDVICFDVESDEEATFAPPKKSKKKKRVRRGSLSKVTLPEDLNITTDGLCTLKLRPELMIQIENTADGNSEQTSRVNLNMTANYQYDNPDDADYCSQTLNDDHIDADADEQNDSNNDNNDILQQTLTDENMVNMPSQVQKFHVPYATQAKRMDMKKLKDAIWKSMAISETGSNRILENDEELRNVQLNKVHFSKMFKTLPSQITARMAEDLSAPLAFVALLHLANEETLKLEGTSELNDIFISTVTNK